MGRSACTDLENGPQGTLRKVRPFLKNNVGECALRVASDHSEPADAVVFIDLRDGLPVNGGSMGRRWEEYPAVVLGGYPTMVCVILRSQIVTSRLLNWRCQ